MTTNRREWAQEAVAQCVASVVRSRRAVRAFKQKPLDRKLVGEILADAATAPSGANVQPWRVYVVTGSAKTVTSGGLAITLELPRRPMPYGAAGGES